MADVVMAETRGVVRRARVRAGAMRVAWRDAALVWLAHEVVIASAMAMSIRLGVAALSLVRIGALRPPVGWGALLNVWLGWGDAGSYAAIATHGYGEPKLAAFFPLLPLLERALAPVVGGDARVAGLVIANVAALGAFGAVRALAERETGSRRTARLALLLVAFAPLAFGFAMGYTESLFLCLCVCAFVAMRRRSWLVAGGLAALATLTRLTGVLLVLPLAIEAAGAYGWRWPGWRAAWRPLAALALAPLALGGFWLYLARVYGTPLAGSHAERVFSTRTLDWPWYGPIQGVQLLLGGVDPYFAARAAFDLGALVVAVLCCVALARGRTPRLPLSYAVFAWAVLGLTLMTPLHPASLQAGDAQYSLPRYLAVVFPIYFVLAAWCAGSRWRSLALVALSLAACIALAFLQATGSAIA